MCEVSGASAYCYDYDSTSGTYNFTAVAPHGGEVTATVRALGDVDGSDYTVTTINPGPIPTVTSISPDSGPAAGGTPITITGTNLAATTKIEIGGSMGGPVATDVSCSATVCTAVAPPGGVGQAYVKIFNSFGTNDSWLSPYTYTPGITIARTLTATGFGRVSTAQIGIDNPGPYLLVAFVSSDGPKARQVATVNGGGLLWSPVARANSKGGTAEIWAAFANGPLTYATVNSTPSSPGYAQMLTVEVFSGAYAFGLGASASKAGGAPSVDVTTTATNSWVFAVGEDYSHDTTITPGPGQSVLQNYLDTTNHDTFWVQNQNQTTTAAGTTVTMSDTAPTTDTWNLAAVEITSGLN